MTQDLGGSLATGDTRDNAPLDLAALRGRLPELSREYQGATPFPHIVLEDFLDPEAAMRGAQEFPAIDPDWISYVHVNERKWANTQPSTWGPEMQAILAELQSPEFVQFLSELTGIEHLVADETLEGGGLHQSPTGGYLNVHADFTVHPKRRTWLRRVNLLVYFNPAWLAEYGGDLELWSRDMQRMERKISPVLNRAVIFNTDMDSFHGHPEPHTCPPGMARQSLALYYFTEEVAPVVRSTEYRARPGEGLKGVAIYLDKSVLRAYDAVKRRLKINDDTVGRVLKRFDQLRRKSRP